MAAVNKVILIGRTGKPIELRYTPGGQAVASVSIAVTEKYMKDGQKQEKTEWVNLVMFGKTAENASKYVGKGSMIYVEGKISTRSWEDKTTGKTAYRTEVVVHTLQFLETKPNDGQQQTQPPPQGDPHYEQW